MGLEALGFYSLSCLLVQRRKEKDFSHISIKALFHMRSLKKRIRFSVLK